MAEELDTYIRIHAAAGVCALTGNIIGSLKEVR